MAYARLLHEASRLGRRSRRPKCKGKATNSRSSNKLKPYGLISVENLASQARNLIQAFFEYFMICLADTFVIAVMLE